MGHIWGHIDKLTTAGGIDPRAHPDYAPRHMKNQHADFWKSPEAQ